MKKISTIICAAIGLIACTSQKKAESETPQQKILVVYYSQSGTTKAVAEEIQKQLNADIEALELEVPYNGDFMQTIERFRKETESGELPVIKPLKANISDYDVIFLGYPVWGGTYANPIASLFNEQKFEGKKVVTFCTFGSGGLQSTTNDVKKALTGATVVEGYGVRTARVGAASEEINRFLIENGYKEGTIEPLAPFAEHHAVTDSEVEIFNQACGNYQFPLGTPIDVAVRETATSTDYEYSVQSQDTTVTIYVTVSKAEGAQPEFTQVVR